MSPIPGFDQGFNPPPPVDVWAWLEADPVLMARVDRYQHSGKYPTREAAIAHALRTYLKVK